MGVYPSHRKDQINTTPSYGSYSIIYTEVPTCDSQRVPQWYASMRSSSDTRTRPLAGSTSQIAFRMLGKAFPNCINSGETSLLVVSLTLGVHSSDFYDRIRIRRIWQCLWGNAATREILILSLNICTTSTAGRRMLKLSFNLLCISPCMNTIIYGEHAGA